jgi:putative serine protease PepD
MNSATHLETPTTPTPSTGPPAGQPPMPPPPEAESHRGRRVLAGVAAALVLMVGSGAVGGWAATQSDSDTAAAPTHPAAVAPVVHQQLGHPASLAGIVRAVQPSVVSIKTNVGEGSGVVLDNSGHILTNNHVVATASGNTVSVTTNDGSSHTGTIVGTDPRSDLAVVQVSGVNLPPATFGNSSAMRVGDTVLALGSPLGLQGTVTSGIVSAKGRTINETGETPGSGVTAISGALQTDAAINPGNSGGALVNTAGQVIGINTAIATSGGSSGNIGVGFAIPSNTAKYVAQRLIQGEPVAHPYMGVGLADTSTNGALIGAVDPGSPAAAAGLRPGDLVTAINGQPIRSADDLVAAVQQDHVGQSVTLTYTRQGTQHTTTVTLGNAPR